MNGPTASRDPQACEGPPVGIRRRRAFMSRSRGRTSEVRTIRPLWRQCNTSSEG